MLVKEKFSEVLTSNPHIAKVWTIKHSTSEIIEELQRESFDLIIDLHHNIRSMMLSWRLKKPSIRFNKLNLEKWLMTTFKINRLPQKHLVDRYFESLHKLGIKNDGLGLDFFLNEDDSVIDSTFKIPEVYAIGVLGATYFTKQIPRNKWQEIIRAVNIPIVLLGGTKEEKMGNLLSDEFSDQVIDCTGKLSIAQSAALIKNSEMVITPDTGMMHIAAAMRKPIHIIWGNTIPQFGMYPYFGNQVGMVRSHEVLGLTCRPCSKLGYPTCPKRHFDCMQKQTFDMQTLKL